MRIKHNKTESHIYNEHLDVQSQSYFDKFLSQYRKTRQLVPIMQFKTNFEITLKNPYAFILLHLKKTHTTKNRLTINIPDVCIFYQRVPYQIYYSQGDYIKNVAVQGNLKLRDVYSFFKKRQNNDVNRKTQPNYACFQGNLDEQFLILPDTDLFIACRKLKSDPFFTKLQYLKKRIAAIGDQIQVQFDQQLDCQFSGSATESFLGIRSQKQTLLKYGEQKYLKYCSQKIAMYINYEHNIRIQRATFYYSKTSNNEYYFTNIKRLEFKNLTKAIKQRQKRLRLRQLQRNKILIMSPEKQARYRSHEHHPLVKKIQSEMNKSLFKIADQLHIKTNHAMFQQEQKNQKAFKKLYPETTKTFRDTLTMFKFSEVKKELLKSQKRKFLFRPSKHMKRYNNNLDKKVISTHTNLPLEQVEDQ